MELWDSGDRVVYTGDVWMARHGQAATVVWCRDDQVSIRFDSEEKPTTCHALSLERESNWQNKMWREIYEGTLD